MAHVCAKLCDNINLYLCAFDSESEKIFWFIGILHYIVVLIYLL